MFTVVCRTEICDMSWIMDLETRKPKISAGLSGLHTTDFNAPTRQGPPRRNQAEKSAVSTEALKDLVGKTRQGFPRCPAPMYRHCLPTSHQGWGPGTHLRRLAKVLPEDVPAHRWRTSPHWERGLNNEMFLKFSCLKYTVAYTDTADEYAPHTHGTEAGVFKTTLKKVRSYFPANFNTFNLESMTSLHREDKTVHGKIPPHFAVL